MLAEYLLYFPFLFVFLVELDITLLDFILDIRPVCQLEIDLKVFRGYID